MTRILLSAAEPSADRYVARLVRPLLAQWPDATIEAIGGAATAAQPVTLIHSLEHLQAFGLIEAARDAGHHVQLYHDLARDLARGRWDLLIVCDYPGFHLRLGRAARRAGVPVLYYVAPQLWAWGRWRTAALAGAASQLAVILPFEPAFFAARGVAARFVGHPLLDEPRPTRAAARRALGVPDNATVLAVLPGARPHDLSRHWPLFRDAARELARRVPGLVTVIGGVPAAAYPGAGPHRIAGGGAAALAAADVALVKSGTATLEAALADVPAVVSYRLHPVTWVAARGLVRVTRVGLANLVADHPVQPELLQRAADPARLAAALETALGADGARQRAAYHIVRERLGTPGAAGRVAALARALAA